MRCTSHSKLRYISHLFSQCDVRRIGLWGVVPSAVRCAICRLSSTQPSSSSVTNARYYRNLGPREVTWLPEEGKCTQKRNPGTKNWG